MICIASMGSGEGIYLFLLGLACGIALLTTTAFRRISPKWLKWLLIASALLVVSRYIAMALFAMAQRPQDVWKLRHLWFGAYIGLTLTAVYAVDQLLRHPAITPQKLLRWYSPFLVVYVIAILGGHYTLEPDHIMGWVPRLDSAWRLLLTTAQLVFVIGFIGISVMLMRKIPSRPIQKALLGLIFAFGYLAFDGILVTMGGWYARPFLFSEIAALLAIWHAFETASSY